jgi:linoleate 10R-lipoxygenase
MLVYTDRQLVGSVFRTSHTEVSINETSSYVDLAPLYGNDKQTLDKIRVKDGRGLLRPDTFAEDRLLLLPPAVCSLLVLFSRNHNVCFRFTNGVSSVIDHYA